VELLNGWSFGLAARQLPHVKANELPEKVSKEVQKQEPYTDCKGDSPVHGLFGRKHDHWNAREDSSGSQKICE